MLSRHGFVQVGQRGSHIVMQKKTEDSTITIPVPDHEELRLGTLRSIIRRSGLPRASFETD
ncbi:MAG: type II toxin-antitoxin system HicA family toxin [Anaerolineae bacterium]|nr:type II toxin-antitoxin system HicA family toxin [Anaerolineae bacterium]